MKKNLLLIVSILLASCGQWNMAYDPMEYAPKSPNCSWEPLKGNTITKMESFQPIVPQDVENTILSLGEIVDIALMNNPQTKTSWAEAKAAAASYGQSLSPYYPEIDGDFTYTRERETFFNEQGTSGTKSAAFYRTTYDPELTLSYTIFDFGERKSSSEMARQTLLYADWMHNQELQNVMIDVINSYYTYQMDKENFFARESDTADAKETLNAANKEFLAGTVSLEDIAQAKTKYFQAKINQVDQKQKLKNSYTQLITNLGLPANTKLNLQKIPKEIPIDPIIDNIDTLIEKAQKQRQDFLAAKANVEAKRQSVRYSQSLMLPKITSDFMIGKDYYNNEPDEEYHFTLEFKLSFPIFKGFYYKNGVRKAQSLLEKSKALLEKTELALIQDVTDAHIDVISSNGRLKYTTKYLKSAKQQYKIALTNYQAGTNTILDVISAQTSLADARAKKNNAHIDLLIALSKLAYSTGSLAANRDTGLSL